jgi:hypothetical protein
MKHLPGIILVTLLLAGAAGCSSDPASSNNTQNSNGSVSATISGSNWSANTIQATWQNNVLGLGGSMIETSGNKQITMGGLVSAPGTYQLGGITGITASYSEGSASGGLNVKIYSATSGTLKVDNLTSTGASGSFSFEAKDSQGGTETRSITNGKFDVKF